MRISAIVGVILLAALMSACATIKPHETVSSIGPYQNFSGRLMVIEPSRRWQVMVHWDGQPDRGQVRLTHAVSNRIILVSWEGEQIRMADNQNPADGWKLVNHSQLRSTGIILPPQQLAMILNGRVPAPLKEQKPNLWRGKIDGALILLKWTEEQKRLAITDITHGREVILIIQP
ncbi:MAG: lipoprotein insertase outer membrane protein LolB [Mariprofundaceae bacterium]|nr:lipoprotein insertase outer membrane protein LolB [Mariprofundaceae bacterium]